MYRCRRTVPELLQFLQCGTLPRRRGGCYIICVRKCNFSPVDRSQAQAYINFGVCPTAKYCSSKDGIEKENTVKITLGSMINAHNANRSFWHTILYRGIHSVSAMTTLASTKITSCQPWNVTKWARSWPHQQRKNQQRKKWNARPLLISMMWMRALENQ